MILYFATLWLLYLRFNHAINLEYTLILFLPAVQWCWNTAVFLTLVIPSWKKAYEVASKK